MIFFFFGLDTKGQEEKAKINKLNNIKLKREREGRKKNFCTAKESIIKIKRQQSEKKYAQMELITKIYKERKSSLKIGRGFESPFSPKKLCTWPLSI